MRSTSRAFAGRVLRLVFAAALAASSLRAQPVADGAPNTLSNFTNSFTGEVIVEPNTSFTLLVLSDSALLTNSANGVINRGGTNRGNNQ